MECLTGIVGAFRSSCPCVTSGLSEDTISALTASKSDLYVDEVEGGISLRTMKAVNAGECKDLGQMMLEALKQAETKTKNDILVAISNQFKEGKQSYNGTIGELTYSTRWLGLTGRYMGIKLVPYSTDGVVHVKRARAQFDRVATMPFQIYRVNKNAAAGVVIHEQAVTTYSASITEISFPGDGLKLPLQINMIPVEYYFVFDRGEDPTQWPIPRENRILCNCGTQTQMLNQFVAPYAFNGSSMDNVTSSLTNSEFGNGLSLEVSVFCDQQGFVCKEYDKTNSFAVVMAYAVQYKAAELLIERVLSSPDINRYTMQNREYMWGKRNHFRTEYTNRVNWIAANIDITATDCYICKPSKNYNIALAGVLS